VFTAAAPSPAQASPLARLSCAAYALLVVCASLAPWSGWQDRGLDPFAFVTAPWPRYLTAFDLTVNVLAYLPLGALGALALYPRLRGARAAWVAALAGSVLSGLIEGLQTYLPLRVASNVDWLTNSAGAALGALYGAQRAAAWLDSGRLRARRLAWFAPAAEPVLLLCLLWPAVQLHLTPMLFAAGVGDAAALNWARAAGVDFLPAPGTWQPAEFMLAEAVVTTAGLLAAGLAWSSILQPRAPRLRLLAALIAAALAAKALSYGLRFGAEQAFAWTSFGALSGLTVGTLALAAASSGRPATLGPLALLATLAALVATAVVPDNPYFADWAAQWRPGQLAHLKAAAAWLAAVWPFALALALIWRGAAPAWRR
jgi:VanZ family protein